MSNRCGAGEAVLTVKDAIAMHIRWKVTLQLAIARQEPLSPAAIRAIEQPDECCIGAWLISPQAFSLRRSPAYLTVVKCHAAFHREMLGIANQIASRDFAAAARALDPGGSFQGASFALAGALTTLDRHHPIWLSD
jgi:hypothetical protein